MRANGRARGMFLAPTVNGRIQVECPRCGAQPGSRCFRIKSWVVTAIPLQGFFTARQNQFHPERRSPRTVARADRPAPTDRATLRKEIGVVVMRKLGGNARMDTRRWAAMIGRTEEELAARLAELQAMPDL